MLDYVVVLTMHVFSRHPNDTVRGNALPDIKKLLKRSTREVQLSPILLGDSAFPHHSWLQKLFAKKESHFNYYLNRARMVTECAFGQLKERWRLLYWKKEVSQHPLRMSVLACIVLHNMCIEKKIASITAWISLLTKITKKNRPKTLEET